MSTSHFLENQFINVTKSSRKLADIIASDHDSRLRAGNANPDILVLFNRFHPLKVELSSKYGSWIAASGVHKGETVRLNETLIQLNQNIGDWDVRIQVVYRKDSADYVILLPNYREPFQTGGIDERIEQVRGLSERLTPYADLAALKADVDVFLTTIESVRNFQQQKEQVLTNASVLLNTAVKNAMTMSYRNLGALIDKFGDNPEAIEAYFEFALLTTTPPEDEPMLILVDSLKTKNITDKGIKESSIFYIINTGGAALRFCITDSPEGSCGSGLLVNAGADIIATAAQLGYMPGWTYFNVTNMNNTLQGSCSVAIE